MTHGAQATCNFDQNVKGYTLPDILANEGLYAILVLLTEKTASLLVLKLQGETGTSGNGQKALQELASERSKVTDEVVRDTMERVVNSSMKPGQDRQRFRGEDFSALRGREDGRAYLLLQVQGHLRSRLYIGLQHQGHGVNATPPSTPPS